MAKYGGVDVALSYRPSVDCCHCVNRDVAIVSLPQGRSCEPECSRYSRRAVAPRCMTWDCSWDSDKSLVSGVTSSWNQRHCNRPVDAPPIVNSLTNHPVSSPYNGLVQLL